MQSELKMANPNKVREEKLLQGCAGVKIEIITLYIVFSTCLIIFTTELKHVKEAILKFHVGNNR